MTSKTLLIFATLLTISSCSSKTSKTLGERKLTGTIERGKFDNDYMSMKIIDRWTELTTTDESQFLIIHKVKENFKPNIIFLSLDKKQYKDIYGYQTVEQYMNGLIEHNKAKPDYKLISPLEKVSIDTHIFYVCKFLLLKGDKEYQQSFYTTDIEDYYLGLVATDDNRQLEPEVETTIKSIKFK
jgi:hypothetical protein